MESIDVGGLSLPKLRRLLRTHYKEKCATELLQELINLMQSSKEDAQEFFMRALNLRQKVLFVSLESNSKLNVNTELVQSVFLQVVESALQNENIRASLRPILWKPDASDEDLIHPQCCSDRRRGLSKETPKSQRSETESEQNKGVIRLRATQEQATNF